MPQYWVGIGKTELRVKRTGIVVVDDKKWRYISNGKKIPDNFLPEQEKNEADERAEWCSSVHGETLVKVPCNKRTHDPLPALCESGSLLRSGRYKN